MTGRHEGPPIGSEAREATAAPWHGQRRAEEEMCRRMPTRLCAGMCDLTGYCYRFPWAKSDGSDDDDPPRCWSCGHTIDMFCECSCCDDDHDGGPDDV